MWNSVKSLERVFLNGHPTQRIAGNLNLCFKGIDSDTLILALRDLALSSTSACSSASHQPSYVLRAIGLDNEEAYSSVRLSFGRFTSLDQVKNASNIIVNKISRLREISA